MFLVFCKTLEAERTVSADTLIVSASDDKSALAAATNIVKATWPECKDSKIGIFALNPRPIYLSIGHCITHILSTELRYLIGYMIDDGDAAMELDFAVGYVANALYRGANAPIDWLAVDEVVKPRVAAAMLTAAAKLRADLVPEDCLS